MADLIASEKIDEIRRSVDLVDVIGEYVQLTKKGRNYFGLCPFHGENTPSFSVSTDKQIYNCFGCHAAGDAFSFIMDIEGYSFQEAAIELAEKGNVKLDIDAPAAAAAKSMSPDFQQMIEAHKLLSKFYHHLLVNTKDGQHALEYLLDRGFTRESIDKFQIGYSLNSWDFVYKFLMKRNFPEQLMEKAGLIIKREKDGSYFDRFRDRIMFPIQDRNGNTIAFSGRALGGDDPKYLNSPETPIFNKSKILYNFQSARAQMKKMQRAVLFEGFADVIAADRAGVENGVATMGTSLTDEHIALLKKQVQSITICYDSDNAGKEAAFRASAMLDEAGFQIRVAMMPDGLDPDDYIQANGAEKFRNEVIDGSLTLMAFKILYLRRGKRLQDEGDRLLYIEEVLRELAKLDKAVEKDLYIRQLAEEFSVSLDALKEQLEAIEMSQRGSRRQNDQDRHVDSRTLVNPPASASSKIRPAFHTAERNLISHMMKDADIAFKVQSLLGGNTFNVDEHQAIFTYLLGYFESGHSPDTSAFIHFIDDDKLRKICAEIALVTINDELSEQELSDYIKQVLNYQKMLMIKEKKAEAKEAERQKDYNKAALIGMEIIQLQKSLKTTV
ncbi:DNA primase [Cytobacillus gottheilii]|uniref:DNA primase n=1 Tax=Cytobacillus gottheilii TaxID=859144 RepID=UPI0009BB59F9|nr:DNA primase [Cytobacillus gottheilii]